MAAPIDACACHIVDTQNEPILSFSDTSWEKLSECMTTWASLDGEERKLALRFDQVSRDCFGYHRRCYQKFTDKRRLQQALKRSEKGCLKEDEETSAPSPNKILRSSLKSSSGSASRRSIHVLPHQCIICCKHKSVCDNSLKWKREKLVTCETDCSKLLEAARIKKDQRILLQIADLDPVSIEVRYHSSCYKHYTRCVYPDLPCLPGETGSRRLTQSFDQFCARVIDVRLKDNEEILKISHLTELFIQTAADTEGIDIKGYRHSQLKGRLKSRYPNLEFVQISPNRCELVLYNHDYHNNDLNRKVLTVPCMDMTDDTDDSDSEMESIEELQPSTSGPSTQDKFAELYRSALVLRAAISSVKGIEIWPPKAEDLQLEECSQKIPVELFNFILWCSNLSDDFCINKIHTNSGNEKKVISLAQDIIALSSNGRKLMPKHLALGMTIRHISGSSKVQQLMNSFGHCVSHSVTLEHDTALAVQQLNRESDVPHGFQPETFTTLVWDNNDFGEETLSGKGTTHNTNGIIIQSTVQGSEIRENQQKVSTSRDRKRTIEAPPCDIAPFHGLKRTGPVQFREQDIDLDSRADIQKEWRLRDQAIFIAKYYQMEGTLPGWTGCNQLLSHDSHPLSNIGYLPVIDVSPTDKAAVHAVLQQSLQIAHRLKLPSIVLVMDQAIYAKAQEIRWQGCPEFREKLVIRLGEFHTCMAYLGVLGKRFEHAGLRDIAIESGIVAAGSINGVMNGHHYNRSLRCHKIIAEALHRLRLQEYIDHEATHVIPEVMQMSLDDFEEKFSQSLQQESLPKFIQDFQDYVERRSQENVMYKFWTTYLDMVELLLLFVRATREGNWDLHLSAVRDMIPWFFSYGRINYSRYLPVYFLEMINLPTSHPFANLNLEKGSFAVKRHDKHGFAMTACDQIIEQTYNRDSKTKGGLTGMTLNKGAVRRWVLSHPDRAAITNNCYAMTAANPASPSSQKELSTARINTDEKAVQDVMYTITHYANPFTCESNNDLFNISSGQLASESIKHDLLSAHKKGEACFQLFVKERLTSGTKDLYQPLSLPVSKTFAEDKKKSKLPVASLKQEKQILTRLLVIAQEKGIDLREVLSYPLTPVPPAIGNTDGSMVKTTKSALLHEIEKQVSETVTLPATSLSTDTVLIIDAMAMIQQQQHFPGTFGQFAVSLFHQIVGMSRKYHAKRVDFVSDRYPNVSIKQLEREKRASHGENKIRIERSDQNMPKQMKKFLACGENKERLIAFILNEWEKLPPISLGGLQLYVTVGEVCKKLALSEEGILLSEVVPHLHCDHVEADTRMFLHARHAADTSPVLTDIIIRTVDTDVFIFGLWAANLIPNRLVLLLSLANNSRLLNLTSMSSSFGKDKSTALMGLHPFTGCDTVSAFKGKGKVKALKTMINDPVYVRVFSELCQEWSVPDVVLQEIEMFVCELYGWKEDINVNDVRLKCFRCGNISDICMPSNRDSLQLHTKRANYQAAINRLALENYIQPPAATENGWVSSDSGLAIQWRGIDIAPPSVLQSVSCKCSKTACDSARCSCKRDNILCSDFCQCNTCHNRQVISSDTDDSEDDS